MISCTDLGNGVNFCVRSFAIIIYYGKFFLFQLADH